jgi:hypothetical protein
MAYTPSAEAQTSTDTGIGGGVTFNPYQAVGVARPEFGVRYGMGAQNPSMPRAARGDEDFAGVQWGQRQPLQASNYQFLQALYKDPNQAAGVQTLLQMAGYGPKTWANRTGRIDEDTLGAYNQMLQDLAAYQQNNPDSPHATDPNAFLAWAAGLGNSASGKAGGRGGRGGAGGAGGRGAYTQTSRNVTLADAASAQQLAHDAFSTALGRTTTKKERAAFTAALHAYERAHPQLSTTHVDASGNTSTTTQAGADESAFAQQYTHSTQGLANEAGTQTEIGFVNVLQRMMGG